jgi:hypothetical protein
VEGEEGFNVGAEVGQALLVGGRRRGVGGGEAAGGVAEVGGEEVRRRGLKGQRPSRASNGMDGPRRSMRVPQVMEGKWKIAPDDEADEGARMAHEREARLVLVVAGVLPDDEKGPPPRDWRGRAGHVERGDAD